MFEWAQIYHHLQVYYKLSLMIESSHKIWCYRNQTASGFLREWDTANSNRLSSVFPSKSARNWGAITTCYGDVVQSENRARLKPFGCLQSEICTTANRMQCLRAPSSAGKQLRCRRALLAHQRKLLLSGASALISASGRSWNLFGLWEGTLW